MDGGIRRTRIHARYRARGRPFSSCPLSPNLLSTPHCQVHFFCQVRGIITGFSSASSGHHILYSGDRPMYNECKGSEAMSATHQAILIHRPRGLTVCVCRYKCNHTHVSDMHCVLNNKFSFKNRTKTKHAMVTLLYLLSCVSLFPALSIMASHLCVQWTIMTGWRHYPASPVVSSVC